MAGLGGGGGGVVRESRFCVAQEVSKEEGERIISNPTEQQRELGRGYRRQLEAAGGNHRKTNDNGETVRFNPLTNATTVRSCAVCGSMNDPKPCGGCRGLYYCGKECQLQHWPEHKQRCRRLQNTDSGAFGACGSDKGMEFSPEKWLNTFPGITAHCRSACQNGYLLPIVQVKLGELDNVALITEAGIRTHEELAELQALHPEAAHAYRLDEDIDPRWQRVVVQINRKEKLYPVRVRIAK